MIVFQCNDHFSTTKKILVIPIKWNFSFLYKKKIHVVLIKTYFFYYKNNACYSNKIIFFYTKKDRSCSNKMIFSFHYKKDKIILIVPLQNCFFSNKIFFFVPLRKRSTLFQWNYLLFRFLLFQLNDLFCTNTKKISVVPIKCSFCSTKKDPCCPNKMIFCCGNTKILVVLIKLSSFYNTKMIHLVPIKWSFLFH